MSSPTHLVLSELSFALSGLPTLRHLVLHSVSWESTRTQSAPFLPASLQTIHVVSVVLPYFENLLAFLQILSNPLRVLWIDNLYIREIDIIANSEPLGTLENLEVTHLTINAFLGINAFLEVIRRTSTMSSIRVLRLHEIHDGTIQDIGVTLNTAGPVLRSLFISLKFSSTTGESSVPQL